MLKYHGSNLVRAGFLGAALIILVILVGLQPEKLLSMATNVRYQAPRAVGFTNHESRMPDPRP